MKKKLKKQTGESVAKKKTSGKKISAQTESKKKKESLAIIGTGIAGMDHSGRVPTVLDDIHKFFFCSGAPVQDSG